MPERLDDLMHRLYADTDQLPWAGADQVRARGRERARSQRGLAVLATAASVGLAASGGVLLAGSPATGPGVGSAATTSPATSAPATTARATTMPATTAPMTPTATPSPTRPPTVATPSVTPGGRTTVPDEAMLRPEDFGPGARSEVPLSVDGQFAFVISLCPAADPNWEDSVGAGIRREISLTQGDGPTARSVTELVQSRRPGQADVYLDNVIAVARLCADHRRTYGETGERVRITEVDRNFAGDRSVLYRMQDADQVAWYAFVIEGDLVAELYRFDATDAAGMRTLSVRAAARLAAAQD
jgi:hypothetical protein